MKTFNKKDVISWSNAEQAKQYIGKQGYFGDSIAELDSKIQGAFKNILTDIFDSDTDRASIPFGNDDEETWSLFIPADKVKKPKKKWRAFKDLEDFKTYVNKSVGSVIVLRKKDKDDTITSSLITNYIFKTNCICIGNQPFLFEHLFNNYEWKDNNGNWRVFGVEEDTEEEE